MQLKENEVIDNLNIDDLKIIQDNTGFKYGTDAVLLSKFAGIKKGARVLDLCTGSGIVPLLLCGLKEPSFVLGVEYFSEVSDMAKRSVLLNGLTEKIELLNEINKIPTFEEYLKELNE